MAWWTIEYGLVGSMNEPKIYGAGLLSSVGESFDCYAKNVKRIPLTLQCIEQTYDITKPQPQLFVTPSFSHLKDVLREFGETMAYKVGGLQALEKAKKAQTVTTTQWITGTQLSGTLMDVASDAGHPVYLKWAGPCQLSFNEKEIKGFGPKTLKKNWECPIGLTAQTISETSDLKKLGFTAKSAGRLEWPESGFAVTGKLAQVAKVGRKVVGILLKDAVVLRNEKVISKHKQYLVVLGENVVSVFGDAADRGAFYKYVPTLHEPKAKQKTNLTKENKRINRLYALVRKIREAGLKNAKKTALGKIESIVEELDQSEPTDWLLRLELLELASTHKELSHLRRPLLSKLEKIKNTSTDKATLISRGLRLISTSSEPTIRSATPSLHS
jgi:phenylalanine-4-hydroxylase